MLFVYCPPRCVGGDEQCSCGVGMFLLSAPLRASTTSTRRGEELLDIKMRLKDFSRILVFMMLINC